MQMYVVPHLLDGSIFQQNGTPPQFANVVLILLDESAAKWIGRGSPYIIWPARSSDLIFSCVGVKDKVYRTPVRVLAHLQ